MFVPHVPAGACDLCFPCVVEGAKLPANTVLEDPALAGRLGLQREPWLGSPSQRPGRGIRDVWFVGEYWMEKMKGYLQ